MYIPRHFEIDDADEIRRFIESNSFGQLISNSSGRLFSTHLPVALSEDGSVLYAHLARANPQHLDMAGQEVLITIEGPHSYISPTWYLSPGVPTWNYQAVHIYGIASVCNDRAKIAQHVERLARKYEAASEEPWVPDYQPEMLSGVVGLDIAISEIQCKYKLSQNRPSKDRPQIITQLQRRNQSALASAMQEQD